MKESDFKKLMKRVDKMFADHGGMGDGGFYSVEQVVHRGCLPKLVHWRQHKHCFETTHVNGYGHPTKQKCACGLSRQARWNAPFNVDWLYSDGSESINTRGIDGPTDWGNHFGFGQDEILHRTKGDK